MPRQRESQRLISIQEDNYGGNNRKLHGPFQSADGARRSTSSIIPVKENVDVVVSCWKQDDTSLHGEVRPTLDDKASLFIVWFDVFLIDTARGIFFPTLWAHVHTMGGNEIVLGYCVGGFSIGRTFISPISGRMANKYGYRLIMMIFSGLLVMGAMAYIMATTSLHVFLSQVMLGVGSGTLGVVRAYVADKTTPEQRTPLLSFTTAVQYCGLTCMPMVGGLFSHLLGSAEIPVVGQLLVLTQFTAPAFLLIVMSFTLFILLFFVFKDGKEKPIHPESFDGKLSVCTSGFSVSQAGHSDVNSNVEEQPWPTSELHEKISIGGNSMSSSEGLEAGATIRQHPSLSGDMEHQQLESVSALKQRHGGYASVSVDEPQAAAGVNTQRRSYFSLQLPSKGEMLIYGGFLLNVSTKGTISCFETLGAEYAMTRFDLSSAQAGAIFAMFGGIGVVILLSMRLLCRYFNDVQLVLGGISLMIVSCALLVGTPDGQAGFPIFILAVFLIYSTGYPVGHTAVLGLFSKVVGVQPQGTLMGWFGSAGALARGVFPIVAGMLTETFGSSSLFIFLVTLLSTTFALLFVFREPYVECAAISATRKTKEKRSAASSQTYQKPVANVLFK